MSVPLGIILIWTGTNASIPTGWQRVTGLDGKFVKGTADGVDPNVTGGASTHSHTSSAHTHSVSAHTHLITISASNGTNNRGSTTGSTLLPAFHSHAAFNSGAVASASVSSEAATYASVSNNPPYKEVIFIEPADSSRTGVPDGASALFDSNSLPTNWTEETTFRGKFLRGAAAGGNAGGVGGSSQNVHDLTHTHTVSHSHASQASGGSTASRGYSGTGVFLQSHTHNVSLDASTTAPTDTPSLTTSETVEPAYTTLSLISKGAGGIAYPPGIIALWLGSLASIPSGWVLCNGLGSTVDMRGRHLKISADTSSSGLTGGSNTHGHAAQGHSHNNISHTHSPNPTSLSHSTLGTLNRNNTGSNATDGLDVVHTSITVGTGTYNLETSNTTADSSNNEPEYLTVAFIKLVSQNFTASFSETVSLSETITKSVGLFFTSTVSISEVLLKGLGRIISETVSLTETLTTARGFGVLFSEVFSLSEVFSKGIGKTFSATVGFVETLSKGFTRVLSDSVSAVDSILKGISRTFSSSISISETIVKGIGRSISETFSATESFVATRMFWRTFIDTSLFSEIISFILEKFPGIGNWLKLSSEKDKPEGRQSLDKPSGEDRGPRTFMSSGDDRPTGTKLEGDKPRL